MEPLRKGVIEKMAYVVEFWLILESDIVENYWLWSLIIFLIQRSLISILFIPHEVFTPQKYVHSSMRGSAEGGYPLCGVWGQAGPQRGFEGEAPEAKIAL